MRVHFLDSDVRLALMIALALGAGLAFLASRFTSSRPAIVPTALVAWLAAVVLAGDQVIAWVVQTSAPATSDFNEYHWVLLSPWQRLGLVLGGGCAVLVVLLAWRSSRRIASPWRRAALIGLRIAAVGGALLLFLQPAIELRQVAREPNRIAILVDESRSMSLREKPDGPRRIERARDIIARSADTFASWRASHHIDVFGFADTLTPSSLELVGRQEPTGTATMIRQALEQVRAYYDADELAGIVLISDGIATGGFGHDAAEGPINDFLEALDTRVHTVWAGRQGLGDVAISRVLVDEFAFVRTVVRVEVEVRATGYEARRIPMTLSSQGKPMRQKWLDIGPGDTEAKVVFELSPPQVGKYVYEVSTPVSDDEAVAENNRRSFYG